ncbi:MAG: OmpA family protein [Chitinophagales bacterium]
MAGFFADSQIHGNTMIIRLIITLFLSFSCLSFGFSQESDVPKKAQKLYQKSQESYLYQHYQEAKEWLEKAIDKYPTYTTAYVRLGEIQLELKEYEQAKKTFLKILEFDDSPRNQFQVYYTVGNIEMELANYTEAIAYFEKGSEVKDKSQKMTEMLSQKLEESRFAHYAVTHPVDFNPVRLDSTVNSQYDEYLPVVTADEAMMVFTRRFDNDTTPNEDFFISRRMKDTLQWQMALDLAEPINSKDNEGAICLSPDGKRMFFAAKNRRDAIGGFDLFYCIKVGEDWQGPYNLGEPVNTYGWESQPSISSDGKALYFSSRRKGGYGGIDIWVSYLKNNYWSDPVNLGPNINTKKDEQTPFIHPDNHTLYFSSNGHIGMGDADLYVARKDDNGEWSKPENLGYPINTRGNENGLIVTASGERAYFSSFNEGYGLDLYYFPLPKTVQPTYVTYVKGIVFDSESKSKLAATIELIDLDTGDTILETISDRISGEFLVTLTVGKNYMYNVSKENYLFFSENFSLKDVQPNEPFLIDIPLKKAFIKETFESNVGQTVVLKNVFFETNSFDLKPASYTELDKLVDMLNQYNLLHIEIGGHTDSIGTAEYNLELSENRAQSVHSYLIDKGIAADRLSYRGYGKSQPLAGNETETGRAINRRTEFKVIKK